MVLQLDISVKPVSIQSTFDFAGKLSKYCLQSRQEYGFRASMPVESRSTHT